MGIQQTIFMNEEEKEQMKYEVDVLNTIFGSIPFFLHLFAGMIVVFAFLTIMKTFTDPNMILIFALVLMFSIRNIFPSPRLVRISLKPRKGD